MNVVRCANGDYYDRDAYSVCPICGCAEIYDGGSSSQRKPKPVIIKSTDAVHGAEYPITQSTSMISDAPPDISGSNGEDSGGTVSIWKKEEPAPAKKQQPAPAPVDTPPDHLESEIKSAGGNRVGETISYYESMAHDTDHTDVPINPVVGWLVCIKGPHLGASFDLHAGKNTIGRDEQNMIRLTRDGTVSRKCQAVVIYEPRGREFYVLGGEASSSLTYYQDTMVAQLTKMEDKSVISVGNTQLLLLKLCGADFCWEDKLPGKNGSV